MKKTKVSPALEEVTKRLQEVFKRQPTIDNVAFPLGHLTRGDWKLLRADYKITKEYFGFYKFEKIILSSAI